MAPRSPRPLECLAVSTIVLILVFTGVGLTASPGGTSAHQPGSATSLGHLVPPPPTANYCTGPNSAFSAQLTLSAPATNASWNSTQWTIGPAPITPTFNLTVYGLPINYTWSLNWGDGNNTTQVLDKTNGSGGQTVQVAHNYTRAALYSVALTTNYTCTTGPGHNHSGSQVSVASLTVYGPAGLNPITPHVSATYGSVPLNVSYTLSISGAPNNGVVVLSVSEGSYGTLTNRSGGSGIPTGAGINVTVEFTAPGFYGGLVQVLYPNSSLVYAQAYLPQVTVTPLAWVDLGTPGSLTGASPWNVTLWANETNLSGGGRYLGPGQIQWTFYDVVNGSGGSTFWAHGPTVGSPVWREYYLNTTGNWFVGAEANVVRADGVTIATGTTYFEVSNTSRISSGPSVSASATPNNGSAPLRFNLTAQLTGINSSAKYDFAATAYNDTVGFAWYSNATNLSGNGITWWTLGVLTSPGGYFVAVQVYEVVNGSQVWVAATTLRLFVGPGASPYRAVLSLSATPSGGAAPLFFNVTATATVTNLSGPLALRLVAVLNASGTYQEVWWENDSSLSLGGSSFPGRLNAPGSYYLSGLLFANISGTLTDVAAANATINVSTTPTAPPPVLSFSASPMNGISPLNLSLVLVVTGGASPFNLTVCTEGPFSSPNGTGPCAAVAADSGWNGSTLSQVITLNRSGNYTIVAAVTDSNAVVSSALATIVVGATGVVPPLAVRASAVAPSAASIEGATYGFVTSITGGVAPYNIQWAFGDGASGSAVAGNTAVHTYTSSGTYTATLTVTDARGHRASGTVGPFAVILPLLAGSTPWWASSAVLGLAAVIGVTAAAVLLATGQRLARRREALNWLRELEERRNTGGPGSGPL